MRAQTHAHMSSHTHTCTLSCIHVLTYSQLRSRRIHVLTCSCLHRHRVGVPGICSPFPARLHPSWALLGRRLVRAGGRVAPGPHHRSSAASLLHPEAAGFTCLRRQVQSQSGTRASGSGLCAVVCRKSRQAIQPDGPQLPGASGVRVSSPEVVQWRVREAGPPPAPPASGPHPVER